MPYGRSLVDHPECRALADALRPLAKSVPVKSAHWIHLADGSSYETNNGSEWCRDCGTFMVRHLRRQAPKRDRSAILLDGGWISEHETPPHCCQCGVKLECSLLTYGALEELEHFRENPPVKGNAYHAYEISEVLEALSCTDEEHAEFAAEAIALARTILPVAHTPPRLVPRSRI